VKDANGWRVFALHPEQAYCRSRSWRKEDHAARNVVFGCSMSDYTGLGDLVEQIKEASRSIEQSDNSLHKPHRRARIVDQ
jgi:hypothetical protein